MAIWDFASGSAAPRVGVRVRTGASVWQRQLIGAVVAIDTVAGIVGLIAASLLAGARLQPDSRWLVIVAVPGWLLALGISRAYEGRFIGHGSEEFRRVLRATAGYSGAIGLIAFLAHLAMSRGYLLVLVAVTGACDVLLRYAARRVLHQLRRLGRCMQRVLVVGHLDGVNDLITRLRREPYHGMDIIGACLADPGGLISVNDETPIVGGLDKVSMLVPTLNIDLVAVTTGPGVDPDSVRRLAWDLEASGTELVVAPSLVEVAGPRIHMRPVCGLPLLHVEQPRFSGFTVACKGLIDRTGAVLAVIVLAPVLLAIAAVVRVTSPGPAIYSQRRVGKDGREFTLYKFRSMTVDADDRLDALAELNQNSDGLLFKIPNDPRVTPVGRWLRRFSLDELPQLFNVVAGQMSLVGPRPALPREVAQYGGDVRRRLLIKPGLTGMWQISGRSDLSWDESVNLDLRYVENWSLALDLLILWKTVGAVARSAGAY